MLAANDGGKRAARQGGGVTRGGELERQAVRGVADQLDAQGHQHGLQLGKFAAVVGCENQFHSKNGL